MLTTDPIYWKPFEPKIEIKNLANNTTYYTFDAFADITTNKTVYCRVDIGIDHHGTFEIQIENSNLGLDTTNIKKGQRVIISVKKDTTLAYTRLISGLIRKTGYSRGIGGQALFNIWGSSTAIRFNERITYFVREAAKLAQDNITIDITDPLMKADTLLQTLLNIANEAYTASGIVTSSDVENFIPSAAIEFGELQDGINLIEEQSNGEVFNDVNDVTQFRHQLQPGANTGRGFIIKDSPGTADNADVTCYYDGTPEYSESIFKSDSFSSRVYGILPVDPEPILSNVNPGGGVTSVANTLNTEWATKFRPPHSHWLPGDLYIVGQYYNNSSTTPIESPKCRFRICSDNSGIPLNAGGVVANIDFDKDAFGTMPEGLNLYSPYTISNTQEFFNSSNVSIASFDLDTTKDYWLILSDDYSLSNRFTYWKGITAPPVGANIFTHSTNQSTNSAGGSSWVVNINLLPAYAMPRRRSIAFECSDPKAVAATGSGHTTTGGAVIESTLTNIPSVVKTKEGMYKYMTNQLYYMARPQVSWSTLRVSIPNLPILPNDPLMIVDSTLDFSTPGNQAVVATTGAMTYEFGSRGGQGNSMQSSLYLNITPVGYATHY